MVSLCQKIIPVTASAGSFLIINIKLSDKVFLSFLPVQ